MGHNPLSAFYGRRQAAFAIIIAGCALFSWHSFTGYELNFVSAGTGSRMVPMHAGWAGIYTTVVHSHPLFTACLLFVFGYCILTAQKLLLVLNALLLAGYLYILSCISDISIALIIPDLVAERFFYPLEVCFMFQAVYILAGIARVHTFLSLPLCILLAAILISQYFNLREPYIIFHNTVATLGETIHEAHKLKVQKVILDSEEYSRRDILASGQFEQGLLLSARPGPDSAVQVVIANPPLLRLCDTLPASKIYIAPGFVPHVDDLDKAYFHILPQAYTKLPLNNANRSLQPWLAKYRKYVGRKI